MSSTMPRNEFIWSRQKELLRKIEEAAKGVSSRCLPDQLKLDPVLEHSPKHYGGSGFQHLQAIFGSGVVVRFRISEGGLDPDHYQSCQIEVLKNNDSPELFGKFQSSEQLEEPIFWDVDLKLDEPVWRLKDGKVVSEQEILRVYQDILEGYSENPK
jgi:hypothetical protein